MGRPRKPGRRHPGGKLVQPGKAETEWETMAPVLERRCRHAGKRPTVENMRAAKSAGTPWGMAEWQSQITSRQSDAIDAFAKLRAKYLAEIGAPKPTAKAGTLAERVSGGHLGASSNDDDQKATRAYTALCGRLRREWRLSVSVLEAMCDERPARVGLIKRAAKVLELCA